LLLLCSAGKGSLNHYDGMTDRNHYDPYAPGTEQGTNPHLLPVFPGAPLAVLQLIASTSSATSGIVLNFGFS
jgi:hypothetical protein